MIYNILLNTAKIYSTILTLITILSISCPAISWPFGHNKLFKKHTIMTQKQDQNAYFPAHKRKTIVPTIMVEV